jgi:hypothetical protein
MKLSSILLLFVITNAFAQTGTVKGKVFDGSNLPFQKAPLFAASVYLPGTHIGATTDTAGYFAIHGLPLGLCSLRVMAIGFESEIIRLAVEQDSAIQKEIETFLLPECVSHGIPQVYRLVPDSLRETTQSEPKKPLPGKYSVSGHVTDKNTGKPISSARISANFDFWDEAGQRRVGCCLGGQVDSTGRYALNHKDPGRYNIRACAEGYSRSEQLIATKADSVYIVDFELVKDTTKK